MVYIVQTPVAGSALPAQVAAVWGGFIYEGLIAPTLEHQRLDSILDSWGCGCIELVTATCHYLPEVWSQIAQRWDKEESDFPGVFEYEVVSSLGKFLGDHLLTHDGQLPAQSLVIAKIRELIDYFFTAYTRESHSSLDGCSM